MNEETPKDSPKEQKSDHVPESLNQALIHVIWRSRWKTGYLILGAVLIAAYSIWTTLPDHSKQHVLSRIGLDSSGQKSEHSDQGKSISHPTSLASIDRAKLRFGLTLGWQLARFEYVDGSPIPEAQAVAPSIKSNLADLLSADGFPDQTSELGYRDLIQTVLTYYGTTDIEKHSAILVGVAAFRTSLVRASKNKTQNQEIQQLAFSALQEVDPSILPGKNDFFQLLLRKQPGNIPELLEFIDSTPSTGSIPSPQPTSGSLQESFVTRLTIWAEIDVDIYVDGIYKMSIDHRSGFDYSGAKVRVAPESVITLKASTFEKTVSLWTLCDAYSEECNVRVGTDIQLSEEEKRAAMGSSADIPTLVRELSEEVQHSARAWAAERLGYIGGQAAIDGLLKALQDPDPYVQALAAASLGRIADPSVLPKLKEAYAAYGRKESYGYMFKAAIRDLEFASKQKEN